MLSQRTASMRPSLSRFAALAFISLLSSAPPLAQIAGQAKQKEPLAVVAGQPISEDDLLPYVQGQLKPLREQEYQIKKKALENLINQRLLEAEAKKKNLPTEKLLEQEVDSKVAEPTDAELSAVYAVQKDQINRPFEEVKPQLQQNLKRAKVQQELGLNFLEGDRKSTRLNSSHVRISYAVFCLKKKKKDTQIS